MCRAELFTGEMNVGFPGLLGSGSTAVPPPSPGLPPICGGWPVDAEVPVGSFLSAVDELDLDLVHSAVVGLGLIAAVAVVVLGLV